MEQTRSALLEKTLQRMSVIDAPNQVLGRTQTIGCVAVEITQRCNLDCTLCYLSEHSQSVRDVPLAEIFRRLDDVITHFGPGTYVQITGGDPTLRKHRELVEIIRYAADIGLYPALFTNGIAATRPLLTRLANAGLRDVAFHVDTTQQREGYASEEQLNVLRLEYIERARDLGLMVIFNTTIHSDNFAELPVLIDFFRDNAADVGLVSFNLQAETGRGEWGKRQVLVNQFGVKAQVEQIARRKLPWDTIRVGHSDCHSYLPTLVVNGNMYPVVEDVGLVSEFFKDFSYLNPGNYRNRKALVRAVFSAVLKRPAWWARGFRYLYYQLRQMGSDLIRARGKVHKLTFFMQNFMDAKNLDQERVDACSFMVMTADGPVSMCEHNARRDDFILKPLKITDENGVVEEYQPLVWKDVKRKDMEQKRPTLKDKQKVS